MRKIRVFMFYRRHLPHFQKPNQALFITWRLDGSLSRPTLLASLKQRNPGQRFRFLDSKLDRAQFGPTWLKDFRIAKLIVDSLHYGEEQLRFYTLSAFVVMSNHVHVLIWPRAPLWVITKSIKGYTARECNKLLGRTREKFWQDESFDHSVRNEDNFFRIRRYIERNPVKAGLVSEPTDWPWSSAVKTLGRYPVNNGLIKRT